MRPAPVTLAALLLLPALTAGCLQGLITLGGHQVAVSPDPDACPRLFFVSEVEDNRTVYTVDGVREGPYLVRNLTYALGPPGGGDGNDTLSGAFSEAAEPGGDAHGVRYVDRTPPTGEANRGDRLVHNGTPPRALDVFQRVDGEWARKVGGTWACL